MLLLFAWSGCAGRVFTPSLFRNTWSGWRNVCGCGFGRRAHAHSQGCLLRRAIDTEYEEGGLTRCLYRGLNHQHLARSLLQLGTTAFSCAGTIENVSGCDARSKKSAKNGEQTHDLKLSASCFDRYGKFPCGSNLPSLSMQLCQCAASVSMLGRRAPSTEMSLCCPSLQ